MQPGSVMISVLKKSVFILFFVLVPILFHFTAVSAQYTFASEADLASITIDPSKFTDDFTVINVSGSTMVDPQNNTVGPKKTTDFHDGAQAVCYEGVDMSGGTMLDGGNFTVCYKDAAILSDGSRADLLIEFKNVQIAPKINSWNSDAKKYESYTYPGAATTCVFKNRLRMPDIYGRNSVTHAGIIIGNVSIKVGHVKGEAVEPVNGSYFYFFTVWGINQERMTSSMGGNNFSQADNTTEGVLNSKSNLNYSERFQVSAGPNLYENGDNFKLYKKSDGGVIQYYPYYDGSKKPDNNNYESGFAAYANASGGFNAKVWQNAPGSKNTLTELFLMPDQITHTITSSSTSDGTISIKDSSLSGGTYNSSTGYARDFLWNPANAGTGPRIYDVPNGKDVTYIITPNSGFIIDKLFIDGSPVTPPAMQDGKYSYTFSNNADHSIHVTYKKVVEVVVKKEWFPDNPDLHPDSIQIELLQDGKSMDRNIYGTSLRA